MPGNNPLVYLDNAAATPADPELLGYFLEQARIFYANPESEHSAGYKVKQRLAAASVDISSLFGKFLNYKLYWTASATEAFNIIIRCPYFSGGNIVTSPMEHPALREPLSSLKNCEIRKVRISPSGLIDPDSLISELDSETRLVAIHHVQSETGIIQNLPLIRELMDKHAPGSLFLVDTVQSIGKLDIPWDKAGIDIAAIAGHKIGAPSGGALIYREKPNLKISSYLSELRSKYHSVGRPDPPVALTLVEAVRRAYEKKNELLVWAQFLNGLLRDGLNKMEMPRDAKLNFTSSPDLASPFILSFRITPYQGAVIVRMLGEKGVIISAGSACEASAKRPSAALLAMGVSMEEAYSALRVSFWRETKKEDLDHFLTALREVLSEY